MMVWWCGRLSDKVDTGDFGMSSCSKSWCADNYYRTLVLSSVVVVVVGFIHNNLKHVYFYIDYSIEYVMN